MFAAIFDLEYMASSFLRLNVEGKCAISMVVQFTVGNLVWAHAVRCEFTYQKMSEISRSEVFHFGGSIIPRVNSVNNKFPSIPIFSFSNLFHLATVKSQKFLAKKLVSNQ